MPSGINQIHSPQFQQASNVFRKFDMNHSGRIGKREFKLAMIELGYNGDRKQLSNLFRTIDRNNSGTIDEREFVEFFVYSQHYHQPGFGSTYFLGQQQGIGLSSYNPQQIPPVMGAINAQGALPDTQETFHTGGPITDTHHRHHLLHHKHTDQDPTVIRKEATTTVWSGEPGAPVLTSTAVAGLPGDLNGDGHVGLGERVREKVSDIKQRLHENHHTEPGYSGSTLGSGLPTTTTHTRTTTHT